MAVDRNKFCFCDVESTGFKENRIVSIAILAYENGKRVGKENILVNPNAPIEPGASRVNGFTNEMVENEPTFDKVWEKISKYFENAVFCGHNVKYDNKCIKGELVRYGLEIPEYATLCTCENAKKFIPKTEVKNYKLDTIAQYFGINFTEEQHHDAFFDTVACMKIYNNLVKVAGGNLEIKNEVGG